MGSFLDDYLSNIYRPTVEVSDVVEILLLAVGIYQVCKWMKNTRAWTLAKGIVIILAFYVLASIFNFTTILWLAEKSINIALIALVIVFQPELRKALESLGRKKFFSGVFPDSKAHEELFNDETIEELVKASYLLGKNKTGALIVIENTIRLDERIGSGIPVDGLVTAPLLINIFEHNTPLHDGAVIIRGNRVVAATCYLPLSGNQGLSKELGTRHRAGVGISEESDAYTIIVSEETGKVSVAFGGILERNVDGDYLRSKLQLLKTGSLEEKRSIKSIWKRGGTPADEQANAQYGKHR